MKHDHGSDNNQVILPDWPNSVQNRQELDAALKRGQESGKSKLTIEEIFDEELSRFKNG